MLGFLEQQRIDVGAGVLRRLLVQQREGRAHSVLIAIAAPDAGAENTLPYNQNKKLHLNSAEGYTSWLIRRWTRLTLRLPLLSMNSRTSVETDSGGASYYLLGRYIHFLVRGEGLGAKSC